MTLSEGHTRIGVLARCLLGVLLLSVGWVAQAEESEDDAAPLNIAVYGASGMVGTRIVQEALDRGHRVTGIARTPSNITIEHDNLSTLTGDVTDWESVAGIAAGQDVVVSAIRSRGTLEAEETTEYKAALSFVKALASMGDGAPRLMVVGGASTLEVSPGVTMLDGMDVPDTEFGAMIVGHQLALNHYRASEGIDWTVLTASGSLRPGERTGAFRIGGDQLLTDSKGKGTGISAEDFAIALVDELENPKHPNQRFTVGY